MQKKQALQISIDFIVLILGLIVAYLLVGKFQSIVSVLFFTYLIALCTIAVFYGKIAVHSKSSWLMNTVWATRLFFFTTLILLFYLLINQFLFLDVIADYSIKSIKKPAVHLVENIAIKDIKMLKLLMQTVYKIALVAVIIVLIKALIQFFRHLKLEN